MPQSAAGHQLSSEVAAVLTEYIGSRRGRRRHVAPVWMNKTESYIRDLGETSNVRCLLEAAAMLSLLNYSDPVIAGAAVDSLPRNREPRWSGALPGPTARARTRTRWCRRSDRARSRRRARSGLLDLPGPRRSSWAPAVADRAGGRRRQPSRRVQTRRLWRRSGLSGAESGHRGVPLPEAAGPRSSRRQVVLLPQDAASPLGGRLSPRGS